MYARRPQITYLSKDKEIIIRSPKKVGPLGFRAFATTRALRLLAAMLECAISALAVVFSMVMSTSAAEKL